MDPTDQRNQQDARDQRDQRDPRDARGQQSQRDQPQDPRNLNNRLHLNFGFNERNFAADVGRAFPTTPSTFPQPVFPAQVNGQQEIWGNQTPNGFGGASYFMNNSYQPQLQQHQNLPNPATYRTPAGYNSDGTNGLVHQFSHQNLSGGVTPRSASPYTRQLSPSSRPWMVGNTGTQQHASHLNAPIPGTNGVPYVDEELPTKNPEKYSDNVFRKAKVSNELVGSFFKENVQRARDRNSRFVSWRIVSCSFDRD